MAAPNWMTVEARIAFWLHIRCMQMRTKLRLMYKTLWP
jgi:hypothetical protein